MEKLEGKTAIVTGAAQGIGAAYARALANEGAQVAVVDVLECDSAVQRIAKDLPDAEIAAFKCDISDEEATLTLVDQVVARFGGLHILINNAAVFGTLQPQPFDQIGTGCRP